MSLPGAEFDEAGNVWVAVGKSSRSLFACHTDTVHYSTEELRLTESKGVLTARQGGKPSILGADDTAGCYIMRQMILAGKPGLYIFHAGEEQGCIGSGYTADHWDFSEFKRCVSFDRRGLSSVITHQFCGRTASDTFALALGASLKCAGLDGYTPDPTGTITDSASYADQIPECTNLSVGYAGEHSAKEYLSVPHALALTKAAITLDWEALPTERNPEDSDEVDWLWNDYAPAREYMGDDLRRMADDCLQDLDYCETFGDVVELCQTDPESAAALIVEYMGVKVTR